MSIISADYALRNPHLCIVRKEKLMTNGMQYRDMANTGIVSRFKQVIILIAIIAAGIIISIATESKPEGLATKASVLNN